MATAASELRSREAALARNAGPYPPGLAMAPHLSADELDEIFRLRNEGPSPSEIHAWVETTRGRRGIAAPNITNIRKVLKGQSYRRGKVETRVASAS